MSATKPSSSSQWLKTDQALLRLDHAIARLEQALSAKPPLRDDLFAGEEVQKVKQDYARLDDASRLVEARLDHMVDRLQAILEP